MRACLAALLALSLCIPIVAAASAASSAAGDWPMFRHGADRTGYTAATGDLSTFKVSWTFTAPNGIFGSPAAADVNNDGYLEIFVPIEKTPGTDQVSMIALDRLGKQLWGYAARGAVYSSPAVADLDGDGKKEVVFGTNDGEVVALRAATGETLWVFDNVVGAFRSSPLVYDLDNDNNLEVFIGSSRGFFAIDGESGIVEWTLEGIGDVTSSPSLANLDSDPAMEIAFGSGNGTLYAVNGDGKVNWTIKLGSPVTYSTPALLPSGGLAVGTEGGKLIITGGSKISKSVQKVAISGSPGVAKEGNKTFVVFGTAVEEDLHGVYVKYSENRIYGAGVDGKVLWEKQTDGWSVFSSPAMADIDRDGRIEAVIGSREGRVYALEAATGKEDWAFLDGTGMFASPVLADIDADNDLEIIVAYMFSNSVKVLDSPDKPDLIVESLRFSNDFPRDGENVSVTAVIKNRGKAPAAASSAGFYLRVLMDQELGNAPVGPLRPGESAEANFTWKVNFPAGRAGISARADMLNNISESDETDNWGYREFPIDVYVAGFDLPERLQGQSQSEKVKILAVLGNKGAMWLRGVEVALLLINGSGSATADKRSVEIPPFGRINVEFTLNYAAASSERTLRVAIDPNGKLNESERGNNNASQILQAPSTQPKSGDSKSQEGRKIDNSIVIGLLLAVLGFILWKKVVRRERKAKTKGKKDGGDTGDGEGTTESGGVESEARKESEVIPVETEMPAEAPEAAKPEKAAKRRAAAGRTRNKAKKTERIAPEAKYEEAKEGEISMIRIGGEASLEAEKPGADFRVQGLYKEKEKLEQMNEIAKRKFYTRKISEDNYKDLVTRNQEKIIELEAEIEKKKKANTGM